MACGEAVHVSSSVEGRSSPMVRTAGIARSIMDCLLKNNGYWTVPVPQSWCANPRLSRAGRGTLEPRGGETKNAILVLLLGPLELYEGYFENN